MPPNSIDLLLDLPPNPSEVMKIGHEYATGYHDDDGDHELSLVMVMAFLANTTTCFFSIIMLHKRLRRKILVRANPRARNKFGDHGRLLTSICISISAFN